MDKAERFKRIEYRYRNHPNKKNILLRAQRDLFKKDILQPTQSGFKSTWKKEWITREKQIQSADEENIRWQKKKEKMYKHKLNKNVRTLEQGLLNSIHKNNPNMVTKEDIDQWQG